jgi:hypothetical protein
MFPVVPNILLLATYSQKLLKRSNYRLEERKKKIRKKETKKERKKEKERQINREMDGFPSQNSG